MEANRTLADIAQALDALAVAVGAREPGALAPGELVAVNQAFGVLKRHVDAAFAPFAAEIARQSRVELGKDSLARKQGFRSPVALIQATTGSSVGEAVKLVQVGEATAPRMSLTGETLPAKHPHVGAAVTAGKLAVAGAAAIVSMLDRITSRVEPERLDAAERELADRAPGLRADELARLLARAEALLDPDGLEPRHEQARAESHFDIFERDGRLRFAGEMDVETGAPVKTVIDALVGQNLHRNHDADDATRDNRSVRQMRADALADLCRHALGCDQLPTGPTTTVIVTMTLEHLESAGSRAIYRSSPPSSAVTAPCSTGVATSAASLGHRNSPSPSATAAAPAAEHPPPGPKCTTSAGGSGTRVAPTSTTASSSAAPATTDSTTTDGTSTSKEPASTPWSGSSPRPGSTPHRREDPAASAATP